MSSPPGSPFSMGSPISQASNVLTPSRKVQALLAQFEDSDSDSPPIEHDTSPRKLSQGHNGHSSFDGTPSVQEEGTREEHQDEDEDEDDLPVAPRSRMAARLLGPNQVQLSGEMGDATTAATQLRSSTLESEKGDVARPEMKRRLLTKRKSSPIRRHASRSPTAASPASLPSPPIRQQPSQADSDPEDGDDQSNVGKSKFLALVEKHRKQRLEKEAEEVAKRKMREEKLRSLERNNRHLRGSSPADDTEEETDNSGNEGAKKLSTQTRPMRKASKKALEEMNRETQRMSRNMQLAHQARTKKKITKDSLLARFNFLVAGSSSRNVTDQETDRPATGSSRAGSVNEGSSTHDTPPTSPMNEEHRDMFKEKLSAVDASETPAPTIPLDAANSQPAIANLDKGKRRARSEEPVPEVLLVRPGMEHLTQKPMREFSQILKPTIKPYEQKKPLLSVSKADNDGSDSDLEVITSKGDVRKYAAFEHLPKRKAKEAPSHLALRSLAHLIGGDERKRAMNAAELEVSLRRAARLQARQERQQKIEELKARGVIIQTSEEREREQQDVEDLIEKARQEAVEIQKREKALAKKEGNYVKGAFDDDDSDDDEDFEVDDGGDASEESDEEENDGEEDDAHDIGNENLLDDEASEEDSDDQQQASDGDPVAEDVVEPEEVGVSVARTKRRARVLSDDEEEDDDDKGNSLELPPAAKTPQSVLRSARKQIPGLQMSDDLPMGLTQAFAATMADSQSQGLEEEQDSLRMTMDLPSPNIAMAPRVQRLDSIDVITDSQPATQTQPLNVNLSFSESQNLPQSPISAVEIHGRQFTPSQPQFEPTQDEGYILSPFAGNRFAQETPHDLGPTSTVDTVIVPHDVQDSPIVQRTVRLRRGRAQADDSDDDNVSANVSAFEVMHRAAKKKESEIFDKTKSKAREIIDEAAEESEDEYAGLGGASDDDVNEEENEDDRAMIDEDTQVGVGDEAKLAKLFADREREQDEAAVSKLMKDITTGALRRKRGNDDLDLSDEEDAANRRREAKRREFARMRRELLKDEAVGKIAEDKKKEAFLRSIEDRDVSDGEDDFDLPETQPEDDSQEQAPESGNEGTNQTGPQTADRFPQPLEQARESRINQAKRVIGSRAPVHLTRKPATLAEIRESVSFLIEEPDSQAATIDLGLSDSEDEPEAYVNLDRHFQEAEADENADDGDDLGDFIVDDDDSQAKQEDNNAAGSFKKPSVPYSKTRAPYSERRTRERPNVVNRLSMLRQASSSSSSSSSTPQNKMAFYTSTSSTSLSFAGKVPSLLRRATTNSSLGSIAEGVSATGVTVVNKSKPERGKANEEKEFVRKAGGGRRNAVNYRPTMKEEKMSQRAGIVKKSAVKSNKGGDGFLGGLFRQDSWA
ncbi:hypothetical protein PV08_10688 [Exophiala spinifera]|uniref:DNA replication checkpoint mediator MRC1 domain-containing protein n=1 Tax=Exophiala spinifera TaxID=91928 RepID=A0A0D2AXE6_9EURO|nr:uncharacterized protein PV08_10688 [Exophiala spinifera]KIW11388.1 hypothetical protein PV08_10688 [Exophiala spinifera]